MVALNPRIRRFIEREIKVMLLEEARKRGVNVNDLIEWLREEHGVFIGGKLDWNKVVKAIASNDDITSYELAAFLKELGVEIPEEKWIEILRKHGIKL